MDFLGFCRRQVGTLQGESLKKTLKFIAVWLMGSITLWLTKLNKCNCWKKDKLLLTYTKNYAIISIYQKQGAV